MMGLALLALIGVAAFAALWAIGLTRALWSMAGAALMLGAIGYAWQGRPGLAASPARPTAAALPVDPVMIELRDRLLGRMSADAAYLVASDAMLRVGDPEAAAQVVMGGVRKLPRSFVLWTALGSAIAIRDGDQVSPAALLAFRQAARLAPLHPAPPFYLGLAYIRAGDQESARRLWLRALALSPPDASYRTDIAFLLAIIDRTAAMRPAS